MTTDFWETQEGLGYELEDLGGVPDDWRTIDEFRKYEMTSDGTIRNRRSKKIKLSRIVNGTRLVRVEKDGVKRSRTLKSVRNRTFPELKPW